jgi:hypothetical protein
MVVVGQHEPALNPAKVFSELCGRPPSAHVRSLDRLDEQLDISRFFYECEKNVRVSLQFWLPALVFMSVIAHFLLRVIFNNKKYFS